MAIAAVLVLVACAFLLSKGTPMRVAAAVALALGPAILLIGLTRPLLFPYGLYVLLIPFDNLLSVSSFGTLTKLLGMLSGLAFVFWCLRVGRLETPPRSVMALGALLCWALFSVLWASSQTDAVNALPQYLSLALLYGMIAMMPVTRAEFRWLLALTVIGGAIAAAYGAHQFHTTTAVTAQNALHGRLVVKIGNRSIDPNEFADAFLFPIAVLTMVTLRTRWLTLKSLGVAGIGMMVAAIALSASREAL
ncbi:MAG: hypothetical protein KGM44_11460, partial [bacterium]|nr:hypothetical protein [bacterium]